MLYYKYKYKYKETDKSLVKYEGGGGAQSDLANKLMNKTISIHHL